ncbi:hypothetical protein Q3C01_23800 [Bradyrhizobium sp. UFLA05-109]
MKIIDQKRKKITYKRRLFQVAISLFWTILEQASETALRGTVITDISVLSRFKCVRL